MKKKENKEYKKICLECGKEYIVYRKQAYEKQKYCSNECRHKAQSCIMSGRGKNYTIKCDLCGKEYVQTAYLIKRNKNNFCSNECRQIWFKTIYLKTDESIQRNRKNCLNKLNSGIINTNTSIQIKTNTILDELNIKYKNEKTIDFYSVDNYLSDLNLIIEVNGDYWHCSPLKYNNIRSDIQLNRIYKDKVKNSFIRDRYNINILYLWEYNINNNYDLCKLLIIKYIENNGKLNNYNSFNYYIEDNNIKLKDDIIYPFQALTKNKILEKLDYSVLEKRDTERIELTCDCCGSQYNKLLSQHKNGITNFCSVECRNNYNKLRKKKCNCDNCGKEIFISEFQQTRTVRHFCNKTCRNEYCANPKNSQSLQKTSITCFCKNCGKEIKKYKSVFESNDNNFCNKQCYNEYKKKNNISARLRNPENWVTFNCENCGVETSIPRSRYKKSKHHYCSNQCRLQVSAIQLNKRWE
jgi:very-short-patch-repair endonuclease